MVLRLRSAAVSCIHVACRHPAPCLHAGLGRPLLPAGCAWVGRRASHRTPLPLLSLLPQRHLLPSHGAAGGQGAGPGPGEEGTDWVEAFDLEGPCRRALQPCTDAGKPRPRRTHNAPVLTACPVLLSLVRCIAGGHLSVATCMIHTAFLSRCCIPFPFPCPAGGHLWVGHGHCRHPAGHAQGTPPVLVATPAPPRPACWPQLAPPIPTPAPTPPPSLPSPSNPSNPSRRSISTGS